MRTSGSGAAGAVWPSTIGEEGRHAPGVGWGCADVNGRELVGAACGCEKSERDQRSQRQSRHVAWPEATCLRRRSA